MKQKLFAAAVIAISVLVLAALLLLPLLYLDNYVSVPMLDRIVANNSGITKGELLNFYSGFLTFVGTSILGIFAYRQSVKSNKLARDLAILERNDRKALVEIALSDNAFIYFTFNEMTRDKISDISAAHFYAFFKEGNKDSIEMALNIVNVSTVHVSKIKLTEFGISSSDKFAYYTRECNSITKRLIHSNEKCTILISVSGIENEIVKNAQENFGNILISMRFSILSADNIFSDVEMNFFAEMLQYSSDGTRYKLMHHEYLIYND